MATKLSFSEKMEKVHSNMEVAEKAVKFVLSDLQEIVDREKEELAIARRTFEQWIESERSNLERANKALLERENELKIITQKIQSTILPPEKRVNINVGGKLFTTTVETLTKEKCMLSAMVSGYFATPKENEPYFIDRNPKYFALILDYLRKGAINLEGFEVRELQDMLDEVDFYQIASLTDLLKNILLPQQEIQKKEAFLTTIPWGWAEHCKSPHISVTNHSLSAVSSQLNAYQTIRTIGSWDSQHARFRMRVEHVLQKGCHWDLGLTNETFNPASESLWGQNVEKCVYFRFPAVKGAILEMEMNRIDKKLTFYQQGNLVGTRELPNWPKYFPTFCFFNSGEVTIIEAL